jgi:hypothetical protein
MKVLSWIRVALMVVVLAAAYDHWLVHIYGFMTGVSWPGWWMSALPSKDLAAQSWLNLVHTSAVLVAAAPVALVSLWRLQIRTALPTAIAGLVVAVVEALPRATPELWPSAWGAQSVYFVTNQLKIILAMPLLAWLLRKLPSNTGWSGRDLSKVSPDTQRRAAYAAR